MNSTEFNPTAFITISNCGGIELTINRSSDGVEYRFSGDTETIEAEIQYDQEGEPYFMHGEIAYYLNEAMRINF